MSRAVVVTGASGFLGAHVCERLLARGEVRALVRRAGSAPPGTRPFVAADLSDRAALRAALAGAGAVVHLAARVHVMRDSAADPLAEFRRVNVEGTRTLLEEAARAGVGTFVLASSVKAVGEHNDAPWDEAVTPAPTDPYGVSKLEAERLVHDRAPALGMAASVLRLPLVYGPGVRANFLRLLRAVDRGLPLPFASVRNRRSLLYAGNAAAAVQAVLDSPAAAGETFFVSDGEDLSTAALIRELARALHRTPRLLPVPEWLFRSMGAAGDRLPAWAGLRLSSAAVLRLTGSLTVSAEKLRRVTGAGPDFTVAEGIAATVAWYRSRQSATTAASR